MADRFAAAGSILPGMLTCLLAWRVVGRFWGRRPALWALALFAVSPGFTFTRLKSSFNHALDGGR